MQFCNVNVLKKYTFLIFDENQISNSGLHINIICDQIFKNIYVAYESRNYAEKKIIYKCIMFPVHEYLLVPLVRIIFCFVIL